MLHLNLSYGGCVLHAGVCTSDWCLQWMILPTKRLDRRGQDLCVFHIGTPAPQSQYQEHSEVSFAWDTMFMKARSSGCKTVVLSGRPDHAAQRRRLPSHPLGQGDGAGRAALGSLAWAQGNIPFRGYPAHSEGHLNFFVLCSVHSCISCMHLSLTPYKQLCSIHFFCCIPHTVRT